MKWQDIINRRIFVDPEVPITAQIVWRVVHNSKEERELCQDRVLIVIILYELGIIPTHMSGFFCNDPALSFPYQGDTVPDAVLISTILAIPILVIFITELIIYHSSGTSYRKSFRPTLNISGLILRDYCYGLLINLIVFELMKALTGMPRPTFFDLCEPDTGKTCVGSEFVSTFTCTSTRHSQWLQQDSYHSFPSGHTALSVYTGLFVAWYLQIRAFNWSYVPTFLVPLLQVLCICYAIICSLTRITDRRHHWWDVLVGAGIGVASTYFAISVISKKFSWISKESGTNEERRPIISDESLITRENERQNIVV